MVWIFTFLLHTRLQVHICHARRLQNECVNTVANELNTNEEEIQLQWNRPRLDSLDGPVEDRSFLKILAPQGRIDTTLPSIPFFFFFFF